MKTIASRFMSFEETLGAGLVKFAYYVALFLLVIVTVIEMIAGIVAMFTEGFWQGLGALLLAPVLFVLAVLALRVGTEVILAILSIDDNLADNARLQENRHQGGLPQSDHGPMPTAAEGPTGATGAGGAAAKPKPAAKKAAAKRTTKKTTKSAAKSTTSSADAAKTTGSAAKTASAAKAATRPSGSGD